LLEEFLVLPDTEAHRFLDVEHAFVVDIALGAVLIRVVQAALMEGVPAQVVNGRKLDGGRAQMALLRIERLGVRSQFFRLLTA
jgi:hypothetical protein